MFHVFVGTMHSGENEFAECLTALQSQTEVTITHHIVSGKRELEAHRELYAAWNVAKSAHEYFVQLDADTVLSYPLALHDACAVLSSVRNDGYTSIQYPLLDFLTRTKIMGLNVYSPDVEFYMGSDEVYCDRSTRNNKTKLEQAPIGWHSHNPSYRQAFHFGLHRGLKNKFSQRDQIVDGYRVSQDDRRVMAILGFDASRQFLEHKRTSYSDPEFEEAYVSACQRLASFKEVLK